MLQSSIFLLLMFLTIGAFAQESTVSGKVTSEEDGSALPGVNVVLKGTSIGVTTDINGVYRLSVPSSGGVLVFSFIGLTTQEISIGGRSTIDVSMTPDVTQLTEVVVVGYGTMAKRDVTGAISTVGGKEIAQLPVQSFEQALAGRAAGVNITVPNGVLNNPPVIRIRGVNSISLSSYPLIVVDGIPTFTGDNSATSAANNPLSNINPADIESVEVLKDASASAIYGSRATAGVILITTKRGKKGRSTVNYDSWVGWTQPVRLLDVFNAEQYMESKNEAIVNLNQNIQALTGTYGTNVEGSFRPTTIDGKTVDTKWYDYVYQTGFSHSNTVSFSGGTDKSSYYLSLGHTEQKGMLKNNEFNRTNVRLNLDHKVYKNFTIGANIGFSNALNAAPNSGSLPGQAFNTAGLGRLPLVLPPNVSPFNADGSYNLNGAGLGAGANVNPSNGTSPLVTGYYNPALIIDKNTFTSESNQIQGSVFAAWEIIKGLTVRTTYGIDNTGFEDISFSTGLGGDGYSTQGSASNFYRTNKRWNWQNTAQYDKTLAEKHNFSLLVGGEQQYSETLRWGANRTIVADPFFEIFQGNFTNIAPSGMLQGENYLLSYFSRLNYDFGKKYFVSVNFRRDGYSAWAQKWGNFYGAAVGYAISEEEFWKTSSLLSKVNYFKVTGSYGEVGNSNGVGNYASLQTYGSGLYGGAATLGYSQAGNTALSWETSKKTDIGFQFGILQDKIQGEFAYYNNVVDNLILSVPQAPSKGIPGNSILANVGSMYNRGIELSVKYNAINRGSFKWTVSGNFTTLKNEVTSLVTEGDRIGDATSGLETVNYTTVGRPIGSILVVPTLGVNPENGRRLARTADGTIVQYNHLGGGWRRVDNDAVLAPTQLNDGVYYNALPKWYGGIDNNFSYKNFDLGIFIQFSGGNYIYNGTKAGLGDQRFWNNSTRFLDRWTPENTDGTTPRVVWGDNVSNGSALPISENVEKGDFLRFKNIQLGYTLSRSLMDKLKVTNARVYAQIQNAILVTNYSGFDPEVSTNGNANAGSSVDRNTIGQGRTITIGLNVGF